MLKRLLSSVIACSIVLSVLFFVGTSTASGAQTDVPAASKDDIRPEEVRIIPVPNGIERNSDGNVFRVSRSELIRPFSLNSRDTYNFSDLLTGDAEIAYTTMKEALDVDPTVNGVMFEGWTDMNALMRAYCALIADNPEYFWLYGSLFYTYFDDLNNNGQPDEGEAITDLGIEFAYCYGYDKSNIKDCYDKLMDVVNTVVDNAREYDNSYDKIKYFARYISDNTKYNHTAADDASLNPKVEVYRNCWNAYGALVDGDGVCEAYAEAFKLLCDTAGIPCISMYSHDHEWNAVKLDGSWYYVDVTWIDTDDKNIPYRYDMWLAVGTDSAEKNDNESRSHTPVKNIILLNFASDFEYPDISKTDYVPDAEKPEETTPEPEETTPEPEETTPEPEETTSEPEETTPEPEETTPEPEETTSEPEETTPEPPVETTKESDETTTTTTVPATTAATTTNTTTTTTAATTTTTTTTAPAQQVVDVDENTGVQLLAAENVLEEGVEMNIVVENAADIVADLDLGIDLDPATQVYVLDITLVNTAGVNVQPLNGSSVTVQIPVPENFVESTVYYVYYLADDGTLTDMHAAYDGKGYVSFTTTHFSKYILTTEKLVEDSSTAAATTTAAPATGDGNNPHTGVVLSIAPALVAAVGFAISKKRK